MGLSITYRCVLSRTRIPEQWPGSRVFGGQRGVAVCQTKPSARKSMAQHGAQLDSRLDFRVGC